jgi:hypothetical protein
MPASCIACSNDIFCIADAEYVICPHCKTISSLLDKRKPEELHNAYGVGLGFTFENLLKWQMDIVRSRKEQTKTSAYSAQKSFY